MSLYYNVRFRRGDGSPEGALLRRMECQAIAKVGEDLLRNRMVTRANGA